MQGFFQVLSVIRPELDLWSFAASSGIPFICLGRFLIIQVMVVPKLPKGNWTLLVFSLKMFCYLSKKRTEEASLEKHL